MEEQGDPDVHPGAEGGPEGEERGGHERVSGQIIGPGHEDAEEPARHLDDDEAAMAARQNAASHPESR